ncbi:hypothetical protein FRC12_010152 [Ceratobasidium sp. 428]|nr:hypothetical protein FRC12_010152 [Ceratobasidium sp. 428]
MTHALFWPPKPTFQPLGDTPAISLTQDLAPESSPNILLLGCGDPRDTLFTLFADVTSSSSRKIDITCCDLEPAVLARNVLLFTLLNDKEDIGQIWNIFYHFKISNDHSVTLTSQSQRLHDFAESIESWRQSPYGSFLKFLDTRTLAELRRYWKHYADFSTIPSGRLDKLLSEQSKLSKSVLDKHENNILPARGAGVFCVEAITPVKNLYKRYWETGSIFAQDSATNLNPTFIYSSSGGTFNLEYTTFPQGFHLTPAMTPTVPLSELGTEGAIAGVMKQQFADWAAAFHASRATESITLRFYAGDAIAFCQSLDLFSQTGNTVPGLYVSEWHAAQITLDAMEPSTPTSFDVIDTSNLVDHLDFYNLLLGSRPLMKPHAVLYTESLLLPTRRNIERSIMDRLYTSIPTIASLVGIAPRHYISGFTSRSPNPHEDRLGQIQERLAWVDPASGDPFTVQQPSVVEFDPEILARALFGLYDKIFYREQFVMTVFGTKFTYAMPLNYTRWTIGSLFRIVKGRVKSDWDEVGRRFIELVDKARNTAVGNLYVHDTTFWLHLAGVYSDPSLLETASIASSDIFKGWKSIPPIVCVAMTVPRKYLKALLENKDKTGIPQLEAALMSFHPGGMKHGYTNLHCVWGKLVGSSAPDPDDMRLEEDPAGFNGSSNLVISFWASSRLLCEPSTDIALALKTSSHSEAVFKDKFAPGLVMFAGGVEDPRFVRVLRYRPSTTSKVELVELPPVTPPVDNTSVKILPTLGTGPTEQHIVSFTGRVVIESEKEHEALIGGAEVRASQASPCAMRLKVGEFEHTVAYPYPIFGEKVMLRIARKSGYVEVIVPPSDPADAGGYRLNPTPILRHNPWNLHHISIDRMPRLDTSDSMGMAWVKAHTALQLSSSEQELVANKSTAKSSLAAWAASRDAIANIINKCSGVAAGKSVQVVSLSESENGEVDTVLLISGLRLDLASNTVICDAAVVYPTTDPLRNTLSGLPVDGKVQFTMSRDEMIACKKLIPAFVERCRTWPHGPNCEYTTSSAVPISMELGTSPICTCGQGVGFGAPEWKVDSWADLIPFATRLAISPLFHTEPSSASRNTISGRVGETGPSWEFRPWSDKECRVCHVAGKPDLMTCSGCKKAKYCSSECQKQDWKSHKKICKK